MNWMTRVRDSAANLPVVGRFFDFVGPDDDTCAHAIMLYYAAPPKPFSDLEVCSFATEAFGPRTKYAPWPIEPEFRATCVWNGILKKGRDAVIITMANGMTVAKPFLPRRGAPAHLIEAFEAHEGCILILNLGSRRDPRRIYRALGRIAAGISGIRKPKLIGMPWSRRVVYFRKESIELLRDGEDARDAFGQGPWLPATDDIHEVASDDHLMNRAIAEAQRRLPEFLDAFAKRAPKDVFLFKGKVTHGDHVEHMWFTLISVETGQLLGSLENEPGDIPALRKGSRVRVAAADVSDWAMMRQGRPSEGLFTERLVEQAPRI